MISFFLKESGCILEEIIAKLIYNYHQENLRKGVFSKCSIVEEALLVQYERKRIRGRYILGKLMIHPQHRHHGYGTRLLEEIEQYCPEKRYELFTSIRSKENIRLYQRMGCKTFKHKVINDELQFVYFEKCSNFSIPN